MGAKKWIEVQSRLKVEAIDLRAEAFQSRFTPPLKSNFAETPLVAACTHFDVIPSEIESEDDQYIYERLDDRERFLAMNVSTGNFRISDHFGDWEVGRLTDLKLVVDLLEKEDYPVPTSGPPDERLLTSFQGRFGNELTELDEAADLTEAVIDFRIRESQFFNDSIQTPWRNDFRKHVHFQKYRALAALSVGDSGTTINAIKVIDKLGLASVSHPSIISFLMDAAFAGIIYDIVWEGIATEVWTRSDYLEIEEILSREFLEIPDLIRSYHFEMRWSFIDGVDYLRRLSRKGARVGPS